MKKTALWLLVALCVIGSAESIFAAYDWRYADYNYGKVKRAKAKAFFRKCDILVKDVRALANKIATYNKPAFEIKLNKH